ncbi:MAG TPA: hypothetical protein PKJ78_07630 [Candidatus Hydrogenedentes bacterium]|nr:hypothetical protein [Candidatus Hydrogenedentota bacterium]
MLLSVLCFASLIVLTAPEPEAVSTGPFPDPLVLENGQRVETKENWEARRSEMRGLLLRHEYGSVPSSSVPVKLAETVAQETQNGGITAFRSVRLAVGSENPFPVQVEIYLPAGGAGPYPAILRVGLGCPIIKEINERGYIFACYENKDFDPDTHGADKIGPAQAMFPDCDWGSLGAWAWGASRVMDYLVTLPEVDAKHVAVTGHSRTGKTALLAGALDERFAAVVPNGSGCGGAAAYRRYGPDCETLELITRPSRFVSWFQKDFRQFAGKENELPFDQHFLRALVAPRPVLSTDALGDLWANPIGTAAAWRAAQPVFDFLGVPENNAMHFREGKHDQLPEDFRVLLDFVDHHFFGKPLTYTYNKGPGEE